MASFKKATSSCLKKSRTQTTDKFLASEKPFFLAHKKCSLRMRLEGRLVYYHFEQFYDSYCLCHTYAETCTTRVKTQDGSKSASCCCGASEHCRWLLPHLQYDAPLVHHRMVVAWFQFCSATECPCICDWIPLPCRLISSNPNGWNIPSETHPWLCVLCTNNHHPAGLYWTANTLRHRLPDFLQWLQSIVHRAHNTVCRKLQWWVLFHGHEYASCTHFHNFLSSVVTHKHSRDWCSCCTLVFHSEVRWPKEALSPYTHSAVLRFFMCPNMYMQLSAYSTVGLLLYKHILYT